MLALDSNVLLRYIVEDDPHQTAQATAVIHRAIAADESLFVSDIVLCETVWMLRRLYSTDRKKIAMVLRELLRARHLRFRATDELSRALNAFEHGKGDFADYLIREHARAAESEDVGTFDKVLLKENGFVAPK